MCSVKPSKFIELFFICLYRLLLMNNTKHMILNMNDTFLTCVLKKSPRVQNRKHRLTAVSLWMLKLMSKMWVEKRITKRKRYIWILDEQLIVAMTDFFMPGLTSNAVQLQFLLQRLYLQPEILKKCQNEIDTVVGQSRFPTLDDRQKYVPFILRLSQL